MKVATALKKWIFSNHIGRKMKLKVYKQRWPELKNTEQILE